MQVKGYNLDWSGVGSLCWRKPLRSLSDVVLFMIRETLLTEVIMAIHATFVYPFVNKVISLCWSKHKQRLLSHLRCCRQRPVVLLGPDEVLANVNWPSIQHNQMEMKVQMHRFIIYARVILIKQTKAALAGGLWHCGIHNHIKHQHLPKEMKHPSSLK